MKYLLLSEHYVVSDRFGPLNSQWEKIEPFEFEAGNDEDAQELVKKFVKEKGKLRKMELYRKIELQ